MAKQPRVVAKSVGLTSWQARSIEFLVEAGVFANVSEAVRHAVASMLEKYVRPVIEFDELVSDTLLMVGWG